MKNINELDSMRWISYQH